MSRRIPLIAFVSSAFVCAFSAAQAQPRLAYVLANDRYGAERLTGPSEDALQMSRALSELGFDPIRRVNTNANELALGDRAADTVVLYFSGRTEVRDGQTYLMGAQLGQAPTKGWAVEQTAQKFRDSGAKNVLVFVQNCYADGDQAAVPPAESNMDGILISYAMSPDAQCAATADSDMEYTERLLAALGTPGTDFVDAFQSLPGSAMTRSALSGPVVLGNAGVPSSNVVVTSDAVVISSPVNTAIEVTAVAPVPVARTGGATGGGSQSGVQEVSFTPVKATSTGQGGVQIFTAAARTTPLAALPTASGLPRPSIIVGTIRATAASFSPTDVGGALAGTGLDGTGFAARQQIKSEDGDLYVQLVASGAFDPTGNLASAIQTELQRMKCYTGRIDGDFGRGSKRSLRAYFAQIKETAPTEQPTIELFRKILLNDAVECPVQVQARRTTTTTTNRTVRRNTGSTTRTNRRATTTTTTTVKKKPAATGLNATGLGAGSGALR